ncbi:hypothetical protein L195_g056206 [Trifolium pratense]|uniref:Uncharacterized protein n=1 Tax=Trifolium pratense TaxID=57577 RepID=A0A2K3KQF6_TRIPR|nr:hypothetical protein L195_g056206 [Trifolium pratense]
MWRKTWPAPWYTVVDAILEIWRWTTTAVPTVGEEGTLGHIGLFGGAVEGNYVVSGTLHLHTHLI